jgi:hypothetical protein
MQAAVLTHSLTTSRIQDRQRATPSMKPQTEKPSEQVMKFFTPELLIRFNSSNDEVADHADAEWEDAVRAYHKHLDGLRDQMPSSVKKLADLCLHDAEVLACDEPVEPLFPLSRFEPLLRHSLFPFWLGFAILSIRKGDEVVSLIYALCDRIRKHPSIGDWPFSKLRRHWLYDEVDVSPNLPGMFLHRVLMSDGTLMEIPFSSALIHSFRLEDAPQGDASKQIA